MSTRVARKEFWEELDRADVTPEMLADEFGTSLVIARRWLSHASAPAWPLRPGVIEWLRTQPRRRQGEQ